MNFPTTSEKIHPPLKWAGGKRWLAKFFKEKFEEVYKNRRFVELFAGGLGLTFTILPERSLINDINAHLINFYLHLKAGLKIEDAPDIKFENNLSTYLKNRELFNALIKEGKSNTKEAALLFYYLNRTGYNGLCRFNKKGYFNVPFGKYKSITYITDFSAYKNIMTHWEISNKDFSEVEILPNDFVYVDPPYDQTFSQYSPEGFGWEKQVRLIEFLSTLSVPIVVSNSATERIIKLYKDYGFTLEIIDAPRRISQDATKRTQVKELLAYKI